MKINLHIEKLVLDGMNLSADQSHLLQATVTAELARKLEAGGIGAHIVEGHSRSQINAGILPINRGKGAELGQQIAGVVYSRIGR